MTSPLCICVVISISADLQNNNLVLRIIILSIYKSFWFLFPYNIHVEEYLWCMHFTSFFVRVSFLGERVNELGWTCFSAIFKHHGIVYAKFFPVPCSYADLSWSARVGNRPLFLAHNGRGIRHCIQPLMLMSLTSQCSRF